MIPGDQCEYNQTRYGCETAPPKSAIRQSNFNNTQVCGKLGGSPFINTTRVSVGTKECPDQTQACSKLTNENTTVCVADLTDCPVTDVKFVLNSDLSDYNLNANSTTNEVTYDQVAYSSTVSILFSKNAGSMPITTFAISEAPCMNPQQQSSNYFYGLELQQNQNCPVDINSNLALDPRYTELDTQAFRTNEYLVQVQSGVLNILYTLPSYFEYV